MPITFDFHERDDALDRLAELSRESERTTEALHNAQIDLEGKQAAQRSSQTIEFIFFRPLPGDQKFCPRKFGYIIHKRDIPSLGTDQFSESLKRASIIN